jgi:hypothetical protein
MCTQNKQKSSVWPNPQVGFEEVQVDRNSLQPVIIINNANLKVQNQKIPTEHEQMSSNIE